MWYLYVWKRAILSLYLRILSTALLHMSPQIIIVRHMDLQIVVVLDHVATVSYRRLESWLVIGIVQGVSLYHKVLVVPLGPVGRGLVHQAFARWRLVWAAAWSFNRVKPLIVESVEGRVVDGVVWQRLDALEGADFFLKIMLRRLILKASSLFQSLKGFIRTHGVS